MSTLDHVIESKQALLKNRMSRTPIDAVRAMASMQSRPLPFLTTVDSRVALVGQVRYTPPDMSDLSRVYDPVLMAGKYIELGGVDAISVFTDSAVSHDGNVDITLINDVAKRRDKPVIGQDYVLHEYHVVEARAAGASVVMLAASVLEPDLLRSLLSAVHRNRMTAVVEVFDEEQLQTALEFRPQVIGLSSAMPGSNEVNLEVVHALREQVPAGQKVMLAAPLYTLRDVSTAIEFNIDAITVGDNLLTNIDSAQKLKVLLGRPI